MNVAAIARGVLAAVEYYMLVILFLLFLGIADSTCPCDFLYVGSRDREPQLGGAFKNKPAAVQGL